MIAVRETDDREDADIGAIVPIDLHIIRQVLDDPEVTAARQESSPAGSVRDVLDRYLKAEDASDVQRASEVGAAVRRAVDGGHACFVASAMAIHELRTASHRQTGIVGGLRVSALTTGKVHPHEQTLTQRLDALTAFVARARVDVSPVVLTHHTQLEVQAEITAHTAREPDLALVGPDGLRHRIWLVRDEAEQQQLQQAVVSAGPLTIIDGHHRIAAAQRGGSGVVVLAELVPAAELRMLGFDWRVSLEGMTAPELLRRIAAVADVENIDRPSGRESSGCVALLRSDQGWARIVFPAPLSVEPCLPAIELQERILRGILGVADPRTDVRLGHVPGNRGLDAIDHEHVPGTAVVVPRAPTAHEVQALAQQGIVLPPKSTYVSPKPGPGVFVRVHDPHMRTGA